ncbi:IS3 family transposase [Oceanobacillus sp. FSL K6-2867]|uniref:IS3 family transposase n=1 Tax=Oceanobacillus sp. FSL K6-2867 TaxID=2954748 RepID=UPI0030D75DAF
MKEAKINQVRFEDKYIAIKEIHMEENLSIFLLCEITEIARTAYYKWLNRKPSKREIQNKEIIKEKVTLHEKVEGIYGYRRMKLNLDKKFENKYGHKINHKRIYSLMKIAKLQCVIRRKKKPYRRSVPQQQKN